MPRYLYYIKCGDKHLCAQDNRLGVTNEETWRNAVYVSVEYINYKRITLGMNQLHLDDDLDFTKDTPSKAVFIVHDHVNGNFILQSERSKQYLALVDERRFDWTADPSRASWFRKKDIVINGVNITLHYQNLDQQGYTVLEKFVKVDTVDAIKSKLDLPAFGSPHDQIRRSDLLKRGSVFGALITNEIILSIVSLYMNGNFKCATWSSNTLYKTTSVENLKYNWHVDYPYHDIPVEFWPVQHQPLSAQCVWMLDDFTVENGATLTIPHSHTFCTHPTLKNTKTCMPHKLIYPKGSVVISHGAWWHSQGINKTDVPRTCLLSTYVRRWIKQKDDMKTQYESCEHKTDMLKYVLDA